MSSINIDFHFLRRNKLLIRKQEVNQLNFYVSSEIQCIYEKETRFERRRGEDILIESVTLVFGELGDYSTS